MSRQSQRMPLIDALKAVAALLVLMNHFSSYGPLAEAGPEIRQVRARARAAHGWIMDIYLLERASR